MSESATVGLELWELRVRKGAIRGREWRKGPGKQLYTYKREGRDNAVNLKGTME